LIEGQMERGNTSSFYPHRRDDANLSHAEIFRVKA
jgi:hypothetical protein